jgi:hypothetical protein
VKAQNVLLRIQDDCMAVCISDFGALQHVALCNTVQHCCNTLLASVAAKTMLHYVAM